MRPLKDVLINDLGLSESLSGWTNLRVRSISADARTIVGGGTNPLGIGEAWYADLRAVPEPSTAILFAVFLMVLTAGIRVRSAAKRICIARSR